MPATTRTAVWYAIMIALGGFVFGYDASVISGALGYVISEFNLTAGQISIIFLSQGLAAIFASVTVGILADKYGRKSTLIFLALMYIVSAVLSAVASSYEMLVIGRAIGGYAFGSLVIAPVYIAEISPAALRGRLGSINQMNIVVGLSAAYFVNFLIQRWGDTGGTLAEQIALSENIWNWMFAVELLPAFFWLFCLFIMPDSPRWLATQARWDDAEAVLKKIVQPEEIKASLTDIRQMLSEKPAPFVERLRDVFSPRMRRLLTIGIIIGIIQQISGINAIFYFATTIFELTGVGKNAAFTQSVYVGLINVVVTLIVISLIDRIGRKPLMLLGLAGVVTSMGMATYGFMSAKYQIDESAAEEIAQIKIEKTQDSYITVEALQPLMNKSYSSDVKFKAAIDDVVDNYQGRPMNFSRDKAPDILKQAMQANSMLILIGILGFVASFALSLGPIMWVFLGEVFPVKIRGLAISFVTIFNSGMSTLITTFFPLQIATFGIGSAFLFFFVWSIVGLVLIAWLMPETKGMTLEEIERKYAPEKVA